MRKLILAAFAAVLVMPLCAQELDEDSIPTRAIIVAGDKSHPDHRNNIALMYSRENLAFEDPAAPRFLFLDKKGEVALGIGGYLKAVGEYDVDGAVDNNDFYTNMIPVPLNPAQRQRFGATAAHSTIFLKMVTRPTKVGRVIVYMQTNFTGPSYGLRLKQAYVTVGHVTLGKARSTFADAPAMAPTVDDQGPSGQVTAKNMLVQYMSPSWNGFSFAASAELPDVSFTEGAQSASISQRFPDIPAYIQYAWDKGSSHIRFSGIMRQLSYRNLATQSNHFVTGYGVQISAITFFTPDFNFFGHYTYGKGIASYVNDLADLGYDLIPSSAAGTLKAPGVAGWTAGLQYNFSPKLFATASYSRAQLYDTAGMSADTYRYAQYIAANVFYNLWGDLRIGAEYLHGTRKNISGISGKANRFEAMLQYSF
ncbi:MAG: hypothetical protein K2L92_06940 [Muribaculaceae bacterium]|nr:hypothetical protein [Muribaculaceae bacterium]